MNKYNVVPNPKEAGWLLKLKGIAPEVQYNSKNGAMKIAEKMTKKYTTYYSYFKY